VVDYECRRTCTSRFSLTRGERADSGAIVSIQEPMEAIENLYSPRCTQSDRSKPTILFEGDTKMSCSERKCFNTCVLLQAQHSSIRCIYDCPRNVREQYNVIVTTDNSD
jgi:hypothetical protein